ncbi:harmonin-like [Aquarana catesbeiana]|uniref:harmonin-like n=1 Tax=Aquarana catesbeiana TaxID=8400 RepID=UPI003CC9ECE8
MRCDQHSVRPISGVLHPLISPQKGKGRKKSKVESLTEQKKSKKEMEFEEKLAQEKEGRLEKEKQLKINRLVQEVSETEREDLEESEKVQHWVERLCQTRLEQISSAENDAHEGSGGHPSASPPPTAPAARRFGGGLHLHTTDLDEVHAEEVARPAKRMAPPPPSPRPTPAANIPRSSPSPNVTMLRRSAPPAPPGSSWTTPLQPTWMHLPSPVQPPPPVSAPPIVSSRPPLPFSDELKTYRGRSAMRSSNPEPSYPPSPKVPANHRGALVACGVFCLYYTDNQSGVRFPCPRGQQWTSGPSMSCRGRLGEPRRYRHCIHPRVHSAPPPGIIVYIVPLPRG